MARETKVSNNPPKTLSINNNFQVQTELDKLQTNLEVMDKRNLPIRRKDSVRY